MSATVSAKWIAGLSPHTPLAEAARHVLRVRLEVVGTHLPKAVREADRDPEHVHQLRVSTRRADAALRIFRRSLPGKVYKAARDRLRSVRQAAGGARDWDVFLIALVGRAKAAAAADQPGLDFLIGYAQGQRQAAQSALAALESGAGQGFDHYVDYVVESVRAPLNGEEDTLLGLARPSISQLLQELHESASADLANYDNLHQVRIAGKRLRYAMEVFAGCFPAEFREVYYPLVEEMQEILGRANDSHVACGRLAGVRERLKASLPGVWERVRPGIEGLLRSHQRKLPQERRKFVKWWQPWREGAEKMLGQTVESAD